MIASNSARSSCSSAHRIARKSPSARTRVLGPSVTDMLGISCSIARSSVDGLPVLTLAGDGDLAWLGLLGDRDLQGEHSRVVAGSDVFGIEVVAEHQLPAEDPTRSLRRDQLRVAGTRGAFGLHGDHVAFNVQIDRIRVDAGQVELDVERVAL